MAETSVLGDDAFFDTIALQWRRRSCWCFLILNELDQFFLLKVRLSQDLLHLFEYFCLLLWALALKDGLLAEHVPKLALLAVRPQDAHGEVQVKRPTDEADHGDEDQAEFVCRTDDLKSTFLVAFDATLFVYASLFGQMSLIALVMIVVFDSHV